MRVKDLKKYLETYDDDLPILIYDKNCYSEIAVIKKYNPAPHCGWANSLIINTQPVWD